jgi:hypothetical protein
MILVKTIVVGMIGLAIFWVVCQLCDDLWNDDMWGDE